MKSRQRRNDAIGIEIAPLIDIVFILLIFFVVSSTFIRENVLEIELPTSQSTADAHVDETVEVVITANNEIRVGESLIPAATVATLMEELGNRAVDTNMRRVVVRADAKSRHETVVLVLDAANLLGLTQVNIVTVQEND